jgi:hypothetical protein
VEILILSLFAESRFDVFERFGLRGKPWAWRDLSIPLGKLSIFEIENRFIKCVLNKATVVCFAIIFLVVFADLVYYFLRK